MPANIATSPAAAGLPRRRLAGHADEQQRVPGRPLLMLRARGSSCDRPDGRDVRALAPAARGRAVA